MPKNTFKRGEIYKCLTTLERWDPDFIEPPKTLFEENRIYKCQEDGTLYSVGSFKDEDIDDNINDKFVLVGHFTPKMDYHELRRESMRLAFSESMQNNLGFDMFYKLYGETFDKLEEANKKVDDRTVTYINGVKAPYWNEYGSVSESLI
jgi:hypothetical protein